MTETGNDTTMTFERVRSGVRIGVLSNLEPREMNGDEILVGTLTRTVKGLPVATPISVRGDALLALKDDLIEGKSVRFWGEIHADYFKVLGPDVTRRTLIRELKKAQDEAIARTAPLSPAKAKSIRDLRRGAIFARKRQMAQSARVSA